MHALGVVRSLGHDATVSRHPARPFGRMSELGKACEKRDCLRQNLLLLGRELLLEGLRQPAFAAASVLGERAPTRVCEVEQRAAAVGFVGPAADQPLRLELGERLAHRLGAYALGAGELNRAQRALAVQASEYRPMRQREPVLRAQTAHQLAEDDPEL